MVDCFAAANAPLVLAEVELARADADLQIPDWCGREVTGQGRWSNARLASEPLQSWGAEEKRIWGFP